MPPVQGLSQIFRDGFSIGGMSQDFICDDFKSQGSHVAYNIADFSTQASQSGYGVDYVTQGAQAGFPGNFLNPNSQAGYSHLGTGNDFISQDYMDHKVSLLKLDLMTNLKMIRLIPNLVSLGLIRLSHRV